MRTKRYLQNRNDPAKPLGQPCERSSSEWSCSIELLECILIFIINMAEPHRRVHSISEERAEPHRCTLFYAF